MLDSAERVCHFSDEALVGVSQAPSPQDVLVTVQQEGVICYDALLKKRTSSWPLASDTTSFAAPAMWDSRSLQLFAAVSVRGSQTGPGKPAAAGQEHLLLSWPQSHSEPIEDAHSVALPSPVHSLHPIFSSAAVLGAPAGLTVAAVNTASNADEARAPEVAKDAPGEIQGTEHTDPGALLEQPWMQEWVQAASRSAVDAAPPEAPEQPSTSGRSAPQQLSAAAVGSPGIFVVHTNGTVGLDNTYTSTSNGHAPVLGPGGGVTVAAASHGGLLAVVTAERKRKHFLSCFTVQANLLDFAGRAKLASPQRGAEVVSATLEGLRLALAWSDGTVQSLSISTAPDAQVSVRQSFARKLAGLKVSEAVRQAPPLRNGRCNGAAARKRAAQERSSAAAVDGAVSGVVAATKAALVSLGGGLLGAVTWAEAPAGGASAGATDTGLLLGPVTSSRPRQPLPAAEEDRREGWAVQQQGVGGVSVASEGQHLGGSGEDGRRMLAGRRGPGSAEGSEGQALQQRTVRLTVFEEKYACVCAVQETAWDEDKGGAQPAGSALPSFQVAALGAAGRLAIAVHGTVLLRNVHSQQPNLASLVGALSLDGQPRSQAARLHRTALAPVRCAAPSHSHFRPPWAERGAAVGLPLRAHATQIAVPLHEEHISRWQRAAQAVAADQSMERDAAAQLCQADSLGSADAAARLVAQLLPRVQGPGGVASLLPRVIERCTEHGHWDVLGSLASHQQLPCFAGCSGVLARLATAHQYKLLASAAVQAAGLLPSDLEAALRLLLAEPEDESRAQLAAWESHLATVAESAVAAAEASVGVEGLAEAALARAQAVNAVVEGFSVQEICLHAVVAGKQDTAVLLAAIRKLPPSHVLALLTYLRKWVERQAGALVSLGQQVPSLPQGLALPSFANVLQWAAATLDAHFPVLSGKPEAFPLAAGLQQAVQDDLRVSQKVAALAGVMEHMQRQAALPTFSTASAQLYSAELLDLRVRHAD